LTIKTTIPFAADLRPQCERRRGSRATVGHPEVPTFTVLSGYAIIHELSTEDFIVVDTLHK